MFLFVSQLGDWIFHYLKVEFINLENHLKDNQKWPISAITTLIARSLKIQLFQ